MGEGVRDFESSKRDYLQAQIGNPESADAPNKKFYDPRVWIRKAEESMVERCVVSMTKLGCKDTFATKKPESGSLPIYGFKPVTHPVKDIIEGASKMLGIGKKK